MPRESFYLFRHSTIRSLRARRSKSTIRNWQIRWIWMFVLMRRSSFGVFSSVLHATTPSSRIPVLRLSWAKLARVVVHCVFYLVHSSSVNVIRLSVFAFFSVVCVLYFAVRIYYSNRMIRKRAIMKLSKRAALIPSSIYKEYQCMFRCIVDP